MRYLVLNLAIVLFWCSTASAAIVGMAGAETGNLDELNGQSIGSCFSAAQTVVINGGYSYKSTTTGCLRFISISAQSELFVRYTFNLPSISGANASVSIFDAGYSGHDVGLIEIITDGSGNPSIGLFNGASGSLVQVGSSTALNTGANHTIEMHLKVAASGTLGMKLDGTQVVTDTTVNTGTTNIDRIGPHEFVQSGSPTLTAYWDDILVSGGAGSYLGSGRQLARQFCGTGSAGSSTCAGVSVTPTYVAWFNSLKVGTGFDPGNVWDDTLSDDISTDSTYETTSTANAKQTGYVAFGNTTDAGATGHGSQVLGSSDTINAAEIGWRIHIAATDAVADSAIFFSHATGGSESETAAPAYFGGSSTGFGYTSVLLASLPTAAQLLNAEVGIQHGNSTVAHNVGDVWVIVDETPFVAPSGKGGVILP